MDRMIRGDQSALADLYDRHARTVYSLALRVVGDRAEAEDVVQEVFTQAWRYCARYDRARATVAGWLVMMARSRSIDHLRSRQARPDTLAAPVDMPDPPGQGPAQDAMVIAGEAIERLRRALGELPATLRTPLELAYYEGLSQTAIAEKLGEPLGTVKTRMRTALQKLRAVLQSEGAG
ncbi:MAG: RNA polymerase sigma factor [Vicinamibacterales bacterium]